MKRFLFLQSLVCFLVLFLSNNVIVRAQPPQYFSTGSGSNAALPFATKVSNKAQWLFTPSQFSATSIAGNITVVYIKAANTVTGTVYDDFTIKLGYTTLSLFTAGNYQTGLTTVYYSLSEVISTTGSEWLKITLSTPFYYDGVQNLIVEGSHSNYTGAGFSVVQIATGTNIKLTGSVSSTTATTGQGLVNFGFDFGTLPVTLLSFTGEKQNNINKLNWKTATEINNAGFELERSADGKTFSKLAFVASQGDNGNSNRTLDYVYNDERALAGNGYYRLKQVDKDGKFTYSNIVLIKGNKMNDIVITSLYPNPANKEINLVLSSPTSEKVTLVVTDITGKVISQNNIQMITGENQHKLAVDHLAPGTYFIKTICANGCESAVHKFLKQ